MAVHPTTTKRKKRTGHKTGHNMTSHIPVDTFDPVVSTARYAPVFARRSLWPLG